MTSDPPRRTSNPLGAHVRAVGNRRGFFAKSSAAIAGGAVLAAEQTIARAAHALGDDTIRVGLVGCGARGKAAAIEALNTNHLLDAGRVELIAMADTRRHQLQSAYRTINSRHGEWVDVADRRFVGRHAYQDLLATNIDLVIFATPPACRPDLFAAAVAAGKHVMLESHVAVDVAGIEKIRVAAEAARRQSLVVGSGLQRRHEARSRETIEQLQRGTIGSLANVHWSVTWSVTDERSLHSLDVVNWAVGAMPLSVTPVGGDLSRVRYEYPGNVIASNEGDPQRGESFQGISFQGTGGSCEFNRAIIRDRRGKVIWQSQAKEIPGKGWQAQFNAMIGAIRNGIPFDESDLSIQSTSTWLAGKQPTPS